MKAAKSVAAVAPSDPWLEKVLNADAPAASDRRAAIAARAVVVVQPAAPRPRAPKTCSICQQQGHTRQSCGKPRTGAAAAKRAQRARRALERREVLLKPDTPVPWTRKKKGELSPTGGKGPRVPYLARASAGTYYRCRCATAVEGGERNHQATAKVACGGLVFGKKLAAHLQEAHELEVPAERVLEHFDLVDEGQGREP